MADSYRKPERPESDPEQIEKLLEIELMQKRAAWQQAKARSGRLRGLSFLFLFLVIGAALFAFYIFLSPERVDELKSAQAAPAEPTPSPDASRR